MPGSSSPRPQVPAGGHLARIGHEAVTGWSGRIKELTGSLLHDDKLRAEGRLERAEAETRRRARLAEDEASVADARVDREADSEETKVEHRRAVLEDAVGRAAMEARLEYAGEQRHARQAETAAEDLRRRARKMDEG